MARNSFLLKAWSVTLVAAIVALSVREPSAYFVVIALFPALTFWGLDGFYLGQERLFRQLHEEVVAGKVEAFLLDPSDYEEGVSGWLRSVRSRSIFPFHLTVSLTVFLITLALLLMPSNSIPPGS